MAKKRRPLESYLDSAKQRARFMPGMKKYAKRKTLKPSEKAAITRAERKLPYTDYLIPVKGEKLRTLKRAGILYTPETTIKKGPNAGKIVRHSPINAVQFRNTAKDAAIEQVNDEQLMVKSHGRPWVYQFVDALVTPQGRAMPGPMKDAAEDAFEDPETYEIEKVLELAKRAFKNPVTKAVYLWAESGRVGDAFMTFSEFAQWADSNYRRYKNVDRWVKGIAILVGEAGEVISDAEWRSFGNKADRAAMRQERAKRRKKYRRSWK